MLTLLGTVANAQTQSENFGATDDQGTEYRAADTNRPPKPTLELGAIERVCIQQKAQRNSAPTELGKMLDSVQSRFIDEDRRAKDPALFVAALDEIIRRSEFAYILDCRERLNKDPKFSYQQRFQDRSLGDQSMAIQPTYNTLPDGSLHTAITLKFNLTKSVQRVLFVYLHELTHLCQMPEATRLTSNFTKAYEKGTNFEEADEARGKHIRHRILGEIEAYYIMQLAYTSFVKQSPRLCEEAAPTPDPKFYETYTVSENALVAGTFAQELVRDYTEDDPSRKRFLVQHSSQPKQYSTPGAPTFSLQKLHPDLRRDVEKLGIRVSE